jgi:hypothetical protein
VVVGLPLEVLATNMIVFSLLLLAIAALRPHRGIVLLGCLHRSPALTLAAVGALGLLDLKDESVRGFALAWEVSATVAAIVRRRADRRADADARGAATSAHAFSGSQNIGAADADPVNPTLGSPGDCGRRAPKSR